MHRNVKLLAIFNFFTNLDFLAPIAILYFAQVAGSYALGMSIFSLIFISSALFEIPTGIYSDRIGRKHTVMLGTFAKIAGSIFLIMSNQYWGLVAAAICEGLGRAFFSGNNQALLYDSLLEKNEIDKYPSYLGKLSSLFQIALAIGALLSGPLASITFRVVLFADLGSRISMLMVSLFFVEPKTHSSKSGNVYAHFSEALLLIKQNAKLRLLMIASSLRFALGESLYLFRTTFVQTVWPLWAVSLSNFLSNIGASAGYFFSGKIIKRFAPLKVLVFEIGFNRFVNLTALFFPTIASPLLMSASSVPFGAGDVAMQTLQQQEFTQAQRATLGSLVSLFGSVCFAIASIAIGALGDLLGPRYALIITQLLLLSPLLFYRKIFIHEKN